MYWHMTVACSPLWVKHSWNSTTWIQCQESTQHECTIVWSNGVQQSSQHCQWDMITIMANSTPDHMTLTSSHKRLAKAHKTAGPLQKLEEQLTCPLCLEIYKNPKALTSLSTHLLSGLPGSLSSWAKGTKVLLEMSHLSQASPSPWWRCACPPFCLLHQQLPWPAPGDARHEGCNEMSPSTRNLWRHFVRPVRSWCMCFKCGTCSHSNHGVQMIEDIIANSKKQLKEGTYAAS